MDHEDVFRGCRVASRGGQGGVIRKGSSHLASPPFWMGGHWRGGGAGRGGASSSMYSLRPRARKVVGVQRQRTRIRVLLPHSIQARPDRRPGKHTLGESRHAGGLLGLEARPASPKSMGQALGQAGWSSWELAAFLLLPQGIPCCAFETFHLIRPGPPRLSRTVVPT